MTSTLEVQSRPRVGTYEWTWQGERHWTVWDTVSTPEEGAAECLAAKKAFGARREVRLVEIKTILTDGDIK